MLLSAIYLITKNFWGIAFVHALNDFCAFQGSVFKVQNAVVGGSYAHTGDTAGMMVIAYGVMTLFFLPALIKAIKMLKKTKLPEYGFFKED